MGFKEKLRLRDLLSFLAAPSRKSLLYVIDDDDNSTVPATKSMFGSGSGGGDTASVLVPLGNHITLALDGTARSPTWPTGTLGARIGISGGSARVAVSSPAPTSTTGLLWADGSVWELAQGDIVGFKAIAASGVPVLDIQPLGAG